MTTRTDNNDTDNNDTANNDAIPYLPTRPGADPRFEEKVRGALEEGGPLRGLEAPCRDFRYEKGGNAPGIGAKMEGAHLRWACLRGMDLSFSCMMGADLRGADFRGACLEEANLRADLRQADLRGASLRWACLYDADLRQADLRGADLTGAKLRGALLEGALLEGATWGENPLWLLGMNGYLNGVPVPSQSCGKQDWEGILYPLINLLQEGISASGNTYADQYLWTGAMNVLRSLQASRWERGGGGEEIEEGETRADLLALAIRNLQAGA